MAEGTVLAVDDEPMVLRALARVLRSRRWKIETRSNGDDAFACFLEVLPRVLVTDLDMPGMNGLVLVQKVKALAPCTECIIVTGKLAALDGAPAGADVLTLVTKPWNNEALLAEVTQAFMRVRRDREQSGCQGCLARVRAHRGEADLPPEAAWSCPGATAGVDGEPQTAGGPAA